MMHRFVLIILMFISFLSVAFAQDAESFDKPILIEKSELPPLPKILSKSSLSGIALIKVAVSAGGVIENVELVRSTGLAVLDNFFIDWISEWKFLPKIYEDKTVPSFAILSIRFDLANNTFETPAVNSLAMILPEPYVQILQPGLYRAQNQSKFSRVRILNPVDELKSKKIPATCSQWMPSSAVETLIEAKVDADGNVLRLLLPESIQENDLWLWLFSELKRVTWPAESESAERTIEIPVVINPANSSAEFGDCRQVETD